MKHPISLISIVAIMLFEAAPTNIRAQPNPFAPPAGTQKYSFYPQGGNFFSDLFPTNFVDVDTTSGSLAYNGSDYTLDGHAGIDTEITSFTAQDIGVPIFAALDGTVIQTHDGEFDKNTMLNSLPSNYVIIDHGNGQTTYYAHFKKDSVAVIVGQQVTAGQQIGLTASSGNSTGPHLHFQSEVNGQVFESFAGSARPGPSGWVSQPPFREDLYLRAFAITDQDLSTWAGLPYDTTRKGTFYTGVQPVHVWFQFGNGEGVTGLAANYVRPDGSVAFATGTASVSNAQRNSYFYYNFDVNLDVVGTWHLDLLVNGQVVADAPFMVISSGAIVNHPPGSIEAAFDPVSPTFSDTPFCRITSSTLLLDPDYDFVRYHYVWKVNGTIVRDVVSAGLADAISRDKTHPGDDLTCTITPSDGTANGPSTTVTTTVLVGQPLLNISTRLNVGTGGNVLIGGFIITGSDPKKVLIRAIGPSLSAFGIEGALADPTLELHEPDGAVVTNNNWRDMQEQEIIDTTIAPTNDLESAIVATLDPGAYTAIVSGKDQSTGVGLVEAYDLDLTSSSQLANISTRGFVATEDNVMIGGFIVGGEGASSTTIVLRAIGPSLGALGVADPLQDPTLELHDSDGMQIAFDDDWKDSQQAEIEDAGLAPTDDREAAIDANLSPGAYTAIVRGKNNTTGVALVEAYDVNLGSN
jgi:hypothetical protein